MKRFPGLTTPTVDSVRPGREEFGRLAREHAVVPVWREYVADRITPISAFAQLTAPGRPAFLLESAENGERWGRWSFVGVRASSVLRAEGEEVTVSGDDLDDQVRLDAGILVAIDDLVNRYRSPDIEGLPPLHGGLVGYLGYDTVREVESLPTPPADDHGYPDALLQVVGDMVAIDHLRQRTFLISNVFIPVDAPDEELDLRYQEALSRIGTMAIGLAEPITEPLADPPRPEDEPPMVISSMDGNRYLDAVAEAKEHILDGDIFQVVLSQRFDFDLQADPFDLYRVLRQVNPSPYMFLFRTNRLTLVGSSPEPLVQVLDGTVTSRPIAGTRRRGSTDEEDRRLAAELIEHPKERAEHVMLVDLARNDVGRVVTFGSEQVDELMTLERYSHVMHLTSQVSGQLAPGLSPVDVLRATLPAGTVSGAPKVRAMEIIDDLEPVRRGPYAGVVGYIDFSGNLDTAIAIRTMVVGPRGRASVQAGAGIVADSDPELEDLECQNKAQALLAAVPAARRMSALRLEYERALSFGEKAYNDLRIAEAVGLAVVKREVMALEGSDAAAYLQGQLSQDISGLELGDSAWSLLLDPDGKLVAVVRVARVKPLTYMVDTDVGLGEQVHGRLTRFLIRTDCTLSGAFPHDMTMVRGPLAAGIEPPRPALMDSEITGWRAWPSALGFDLYGAGYVLPNATRVPKRAVEALRIEAGWPVAGVDLRPGDVPADAGRHIIEATVSFDKGCYTGQELVERMDARGASSPRPLRGVVMNEGAAVPPSGAELVIGGEVAGAITSSAFAVWRGAPVALARVARRFVPPMVGVVRWRRDEVGARLVDLPMRPTPAFDRIPST